MIHCRAYKLYNHNTQASHVTATLSRLKQDRVWKAQINFTNSGSHNSFLYPPRYPLPKDDAGIERCLWVVQRTHRLERSVRHLVVSLASSGASAAVGRPIGPSRAFAAEASKDLGLFV
jgi:hypothetical protein